MTSFEKYSFGADSTLTNGPKNGQKVFCFQPNKAAMTAGIPFKIDVNGVVTGSPEDLYNYNFILTKLGLASNEHDFENTLEQTKTLKGAAGAENAYLKKKSILVKELNYKIGKFILETLHSLYWFSFLHLGDTTARMTGIDIDDALELIDKPMRGLLIVYFTSIEQKMPSDLSAKTLKNLIGLENLEREQEIDSMAVKKNEIKKNKNKKQ